jgi:hypothetical protein
MSRGYWRKRYLMRRLKVMETLLPFKGRVRAGWPKAMGMGDRRRNHNQMLAS